MAALRFVPTRSPQPVLGAGVLGLRGVDEFEVAERVSAGLPTDAVRSLAKRLGVPDRYVLEVADIPESTFHSRRAEGKPLSPEASGRVYRVAKAVEAAEAYFEGDREAARRWLTHSKVALGGRTPLEFARTPEGSDYVVKLLDRMAHGVVS
mgnify:CR=1 FL=1